MGRDWKETNSYTLTSKEVEQLLLGDFGDKLQPVNDAKMAKQRLNRARQHAQQEAAKGNDDDQTPL